MTHMATTGSSQTQSDISDHVTSAVERGDWKQIANWIQNGDLNDLDRRWAVQQACVQCDDEFRMVIILQHCVEDLRDVVLTHILSRGLWWSLGRVLRKDFTAFALTDSQIQWLVQEGCKGASDSYVVRTLLPRCADSQLQTVLWTLVKRHLWHSVKTVLQRIGVLVDPQLIQELCKSANEDFLTDTVLPVCADDLLDCTVAPLVDQKFWRCVTIVLKRGLSDSQRIWAVQEACKRAEDKVIETSMLRFCADNNERDSLLPILVERHLKRALTVILKHGVSLRQNCWAVQEVSKWADDSFFEGTMSVLVPYIAHSQLESLLTTLTERNLWKSVVCVIRYNTDNSKHPVRSLPSMWKRADQYVLTDIIRKGSIRLLKLDTAVNQLAERGLWGVLSHLLQKCVSDTLYVWNKVDKTEEPDAEMFWNIVESGCAHVEFWKFEKEWIMKCKTDRHSLQKCFEVFFPDCALFCEAVMELVKETWINANGQVKERPASSSLAAEQAKSVMTKLNGFIQEIKLEEGEEIAYCVWQNMYKWFDFSMLSTDVKHVFCAVHFMKLLMKQLCIVSQQEIEAILVTLAAVPVLPDVQSVLLRVMLRLQKWDIISRACVCRVWEQDRRQLFQAAVKGKQWSAVRQWVQHTQCNQQRTWIREEAVKEQQWDIVTLLTDHGLSDSELANVYCLLARHADWNTVVDMLETAGDVSQIRNVLVSQLNKEDSSVTSHDLHHSLHLLKLFENKVIEKSKTVKSLHSALEQGEWSVAGHYIHHDPNPDHVACALRTGIAQKAWRFVLQLVSQVVEESWRDSLFREMVSLQQWVVCIALIEGGVSGWVCVEQLPELIKHSQWMLVSRVVQSKEVDDSVRRSILQQAMQVQEGNVIAQCISNMRSPLSAAEREVLYPWALNCQMWLAVKALIEEGSIGIQHLMNDTLLLAIEHRQWDVVDLCQCHHTNINTPAIHRLVNAMEADGFNMLQVMMELKKRGCDSHVLDRAVYDKLHVAIDDEDWDAVKVLIQYQGDINDPSLGWSIFERLINLRQADVLETALMWHPDQHSVVNLPGDTSLHAACLSSWPSTLSNLVALKVNPFTLARHRLSALSYAVCNRTCPQEMVAECIRLGFATHHLHIPDIGMNTQGASPKMLRHRDLAFWLASSPLFLAVLRGLPIITKMLYEAGSSSFTELFVLRQLVFNEHFRSEVLKYLPEIRSSFFVVKNINLCGDKVSASDDSLVKLITTPRSLMSSCRLVISRCFHHNYHSSQQDLSSAVKQLNLPKAMKDYVLFLDLADPHFGKGDEEQ